MMRFEDFKRSLLEYLATEQQLEQRDIEMVARMSREDKIEAGLLIADLSVAKSDNNVYVLNAPDNYSKLRAGDRVWLKHTGESSGLNALVVDVTTDTITVSSDKNLDEAKVYDLEMDSPDLLGSLIACLNGIEPATPGASFLRMLSGEEEVTAEDFLRLDPEEISGFDGIYVRLNEQQKIAVNSMLNFYPIHVLQGPPGTGKTLVLAATAIAASLKNREVVVIANTHQAVNNALLKIRQIDEKVPLFKIGELLKADDLGDDIHKFRRFAEYNDYSRENRRKKKYGHIIGMTIWGAISNLGLRSHGHFRPYVALVDEASLMPLTYASILGKCSSSICLFGDSSQMPPIFRQELENDALSESVLDYCAEKVKGVPVCVLPETHRMNDEITKVVSKSFYEPYGIKLHSATEIAGNRYISPFFDKLALTSSVAFMPPDVSTPMCQEENEGEADGVARLIKELIEEGHPAKEIAVITPFRKQVRLLRSKVQAMLPKDQMPLIDTVERLQGQDVDCIILSFAASDSGFIKDMQEFLFNSNRLNVMISRAKTKVVIFCCEKVRFLLNSIFSKRIQHEEGGYPLDSKEHL